MQYNDLEKDSGAVGHPVPVVRFVGAPENYLPPYPWEMFEEKNYVPKKLKETVPDLWSSATMLSFYLQ